MIQANELRIGSWFYYDHGDGRTGFAQVKLGVDIDLIRTGHINADSIPLTPELLRKCGFTSPDWSDEVIEMPVTGAYEFTWNEQKKRVELECEDSHYSFEFEDNPILYIHQLQNLYYALTGQELEIKSLLP